MRVRQLSRLTSRSQPESRPAGARLEAQVESRKVCVPTAVRSAAAADSLAEFYDAYAARAYGLARTLLVHDRTTAEDIVAEAFAAIWRSGSRAGEGETGVLGCMLLRRIRKRCLDRVRGQQNALGGEEAQRLPARSRGLAAGAGAVPTPETVRDSLDALSVDERECIERAVFRGKTSTEIAGETGLSRGAVHQAMRHGLHSLRDQFSTDRTGGPEDAR